MISSSRLKKEFMNKRKKLKTVFIFPKKSITKTLSWKLNNQSSRLFWRKIKALKGIMHWTLHHVKRTILILKIFILYWIMLNPFARKKNLWRRLYKKHKFLKEKVSEHLLDKLSQLIGTNLVKLSIKKVPISMGLIQCLRANKKLKIFTH